VGGGETCLPGCSRWDGDSTPWCDPANDGWQVQEPACAWKPENLHAMLEAREAVRTHEMKPPQKFWNDNKYYNELIFDASDYSEQLPRSLLAVFHLVDDCGDSHDGPKCEAYGRAAHAAITKHFRLDPAQLPLLRLDLWNWETPFSDHTPYRPPPPPAADALIVAASALPVEACTSPWCDTVAAWMSPYPKDFKFQSMWNLGFQRRQPFTVGCWDWPEHGNGDGERFFRETLAGKTCDRNWLEGGVGSANTRPYSGGPQSPALLGFDETILEFCSGQLGMDPWDGGDLNHKLAQRCLQAHRNVLRVLIGGWSMCTNLQWQMCALTGKLPGQGSSRISFATAPKSMQLQWWTDPGATRPTYPCEGSWCDPNGYTVGDVFFAEMAISTTLCRNRAQLYRLRVGEFFVCDLDEDSYYNWAKVLLAS